MKERPIIFSTEMVKAIMEGSKTQTRRVIKPQPTTNEICNKWVFNHKDGVHWWWLTETPDIAFMRQFCPYGQAGDRLWVREKALYWDGGAAGISAVVYEDDPEVPGLLEDNNRLFVARTLSNIQYGENVCGKWQWKPSIHMYRCDSRITLEIVKVRVERLQEITEGDAIAEGIEVWEETYREYDKPNSNPGWTRDAILSYRTLWNSLNAKRGYSWEMNPWVWVIEFKGVS